MNSLNYNQLTIPEATKIQLELKEKIRLVPLNKEIKTIAGADISFNKYSPDVYAGIVLLSYPELKPLSRALVKIPVTFPYVPGYLAFREVPALLEAWKLLLDKPDVLIVDGHGIAHPRGMGIAAHFGALTDQVSMGCAKKILYGRISEPLEEAGSSTPIYDKKKEEVIGWTFRSKNKVKPLFISPGHKMSVEDSLTIIRGCMGRYRLPEPTRLAHHTVNLFRTGELEQGFALFSID
ncbi:MAG: Deoxyribonuclease [Cytophagaceae bacterium]|jgi:deoxyribonuclease V|nr:Deoxyribonuclease [Cytophagaceae bacterium]